MNDYKELIDSLHICVKYNKTVDALCNAEFAADAIEQLVKERDAAAKWVPRQCGTCKHFKSDERTKICFKGGCADWKRMENWKWRGVQE